MSEHHEHNDFLPQAEDEQNVVVLVKKIQQQLISLEKKIDALISQSQAKPFREKRFSRPFRSFSHHHRRPDREYDNVSGEKKFHSGRHFEKRHGEENREFGYNKKTYDGSENTFGKKQNFKKHHDKENRGFEQKNKTFYYKQRDKR